MNWGLDKGLKGVYIKLMISKAKRPQDKLFKSFVGEVYDARQRHNTAEDGLREFDYDSGTYVDKQNYGVPTLATKE